LFELDRYIRFALVTRRRCSMESQYEEFAKEMERKEILFELFEELEASEKHKRKQRHRLKRSYERTITGFGTVERIEKNRILWRREGGELVGPVMMTESICQNLLVGDELMMTLGRRGSEWRVVFVGAMASPLTGTMEVEELKWDA